MITTNHCIAGELGMFWTIFFTFWATLSSAQAHNNVKYLFSHGLSDSHKQVNKYTKSLNKKKPYIIQNPFVTFDYPDVGKGILKLNRLQTSLAQNNEIERLAQTFFSQLNNQPEVVLVGVSRGASTIVNFMGLYNPHNVSAIILESPFDCVESIAQKLINETKWGCIPGIRKNYGSIMSFIFCKYNPHGIRPIDMASRIRKDLPILIICSSSDKVVPVWASINLYYELKQSGHENAHLLVIPEGDHAKLINHQKYSSWYQNVTHAFYQKYHLPHNSALAEHGLSLFNCICQPNITELETFYPGYLKTATNYKINSLKLPTITQNKIAYNKSKKCCR